MRRRGGERPLTGEIEVPGDKSISHRVLILGALADGSTRATGANAGEDVRATASAVEALGATCRLDWATGEVEVEGFGPGGPAEPSHVLDCGNSGTTLRLALGVCAAGEGLSVLTGDASLIRRPMGRVAQPLREMGAAIDGRDGGEHAPLAVRGGALKGIDHVSPVASAQVKSALLLAGLFAEGRTSVTEPSLSRDHTERLLMAAGVELSRSETTVAVDGGVRPAPLELKVPGDISSALYLLAAALVVPGSDLTVTGVGLNPTRTAALDVLAGMGADIVVEREGEEAGEPVGRVRARASDLFATRIGPEGIPGLIDELPILAVLAATADGETVVTGASELRLKESDRIETVVGGLRALGVDAEALPDGFVVRGRTRIGGGEIASHDDHRIALAFAVAALIATERVRITGWGAAETSFPGFLDLLRKVRGGRR